MALLPKRAMIFWIGIFLLGLYNEKVIKKTKEIGL